MARDIRQDAARYYDASPHPPDDVPFYSTRMPSAGASVLELGCGTGRVLIPLANSCAFIQGLDRSEAMLAIARRKLEASGLGASRARIDRADVTAFDLGRRFELVTAPFRVLQALETDHEVSGLLDGIRRHLAPGGRAILTAFNPLYDPEGIRRDWVKPDLLAWEVPFEGGQLECWNRQQSLNRETLVLYPELIYRLHRDGELVEEVVFPIVMRCWYPDTLERLVSSHGFAITGRWGGYHGEAWGDGNELVIELTSAG